LVVTVVVWLVDADDEIVVEAVLDTVVDADELAEDV
jgi:hypothetical protein